MKVEPNERLLCREEYKSCVSVNMVIDNAYDIMVLHIIYVKWLNIMACRPVARHRPRENGVSDLSQRVEAKCFSETLVDFQRSTSHYIPEARTVHNESCNNFHSYSKTLPTF